MAEHTCITEERLTTLIKKIFEEEFQKQQDNILKIISANLEITKQELKNVRSEINDLKTSIEFTESVIDEKVNTLEYFRYGCLYV